MEISEQNFSTLLNEKQLTKDILSCLSSDKRFRSFKLPTNFCQTAIATSGCWKWVQMSVNEKHQREIFAASACENFIVGVTIALQRLPRITLFY